MKARLVSVRGKPCWVVPLGRKEVGRRVRVFGETKEQALARAQDKLEELREHGHGHGTITATHRAIIAEWRERLTPEQMVAAFAAYQASLGCTRSVAACVADYIASKTASKGGRAAWSREQQKSAVSRLNRFLGTFGARIMGEIIPGELEDFVKAQSGSAGNFHRTLRALFGHARRHRWISKSPFEEMAAAPTGDDELKDLMSPALFRSLLRHAAGMEPGLARCEPVLAALVLGGLCGLRTAEARRLTWGKVDLAAGRLALDRDTTRKRGLRGRYIEMEPAALAWLLTLTAGEPGARVVQLSEKNFRLHRTAIASAAKLPGWSHNILRRSFASHHLAAYENGARTASVMGHTDAGTTFAKYRVPATRAAGEEWFSLSPTVCG